MIGSSMECLITKVAGKIDSFMFFRLFRQLIFLKKSIHSMNQFYIQKRQQIQGSQKNITLFGIGFTFLSCKVFKNTFSTKLMKYISGILFYKSQQTFQIKLSYLQVKASEQIQMVRSQPITEQYDHNQAKYVQYKDKEEVQKILMHEILKCGVQEMYQISTQLLYAAYNGGTDQFSSCILSPDCLTPYFYFFSHSAQYMNRHNFHQNSSSCHQTPIQTLPNVFQPIINRNFASFQKENEKKNDVSQTPQKSNANNQSENKQKFGRNIISNIFHLMIKFIRRSKKIREMIIKIIKKYGMIIKINEFHHIFKKMTGKVNPYATNYQMKEIWLGSENNQNSQRIKAQKEQQSCKIFRILGRVYLERYHLPYVYNSNKIKRESKKLHRSCIRKIYMI